MLARRPRIVVFGMITKMPVAGVIWQTVQYLIGFRELGYAVTYVEAHGRTPTMFMDQAEDDGWTRAAHVLAGVMDRFGFGKDWAYEDLDAGRHFGLDEAELRRRYASADLLINLHGGMLPLPKHIETGRLVYLETDPVEVQVQLAEGRADTIAYLESHVAHFSFGENLGHQDCGVPISDRFTFLPTRQPVVMDLWKRAASRPGIALTTVGNWAQAWRQVRLGGEVYTWSKDHEFLKFIDLPSKTTQPIELALSRSSITREQREHLERKGWRYRDALEFSLDLDEYRDYLRSSRGEFTVAKDQNVRLRSGWFSDRSATYLAAGRPVITQETGFSNVLPTGEGLFAFTTMDQILESIDAMNADYDRQASAAREIAQEFFAHDVVLPRLLEDSGIDRARPAATERSMSGTIPSDLLLQPVSRRPLRLPQATMRRIEAMPVPSAVPHSEPPARGSPLTSVVVVSYDTLALTKLCLTSLLTNTDPPFEVVVVDNGSTDGSQPYLRELAARHPQVRILANEENRGFAAAVNQGAAESHGDALVILNNDTVLSPGWLPAMLRHLRHSRIGLVGAVTNRSGTGAEVPAAYSTYGEFVREAASRAQERAGEHFDIDTAAMFCAAIRRSDFEQIGPLDEGYGLGLFEDNDYSMRVRASGYRVVCGDDVLVHHFGEASFGKLVRTGEHARIFEENRRRFEDRWGSWDGHVRRPDREYQSLVRRVRDIVRETVPLDATILVISRGDDTMLDLGGRTAWHFPQANGDGYAGHYPASDQEALAQLEELRRRGAAYLVLPATGSWWLSYYTEFADRLRSSRVVDVPGTCSIYALARSADGSTHVDPVPLTSPGAS
jgi:GT2 family glycosyltransferase